MQTSRLALATALGVTATATAAAAQPDAWDLIKGIEINEVVTDTTYEVQKSFPGPLAQGAVEVDITGYAVPALPGETIQELLMVSDMGNCPFCGNSDHGATLQVSLVDPITTLDETKRITIRGTLTPVTDPETWQAAILKDAQIVID